MDTIRTKDLLDLIDNGLKREVDKVRLLRSLVETCTDIEQVFSFSDNPERDGHRNGLALILDDLIVSFDGLYKKLDDEYVEEIISDSRKGLQIQEA